MFKDDRPEGTLAMKRAGVLTAQTTVIGVRGDSRQRRGAAPRDPARD